MNRLDSGPKTHKIMAMVIVLATVGVSCAGPRIVTHSTTRKDSMKFIYREGTKVGAVHCKVGDSKGSLKSCKEMEVNFND